MLQTSNQLRVISLILCAALVAGWCLDDGQAWPASSTEAASSSSHPEEDDTVALGGFLGGNECREDEQLAPGKLPECEPTCQDPKPACLRVFYTSLDFYPCFCKAPLVRCKKSGKCISLEECKKWQQMATGEGGSNNF